MRVFDQYSRQQVQSVIDANLAQLQQLPGFISAEPGFPIVDGAILREPAILVFVAQKKPETHLLAEERMPRQLGPYRVAVMQADPLRQIEESTEHVSLTAAITASASGLTYQPLPGNPIDATFEVAKPMVCHVGPDAGWPVLKPFLEATASTLSVAMYDLNADYIAKAFIDTVKHNDIKVVLTWDDGMTALEEKIRKKLRTQLKGNLDGWIVKTGNNHRFASAYHEKVAVRDHESFWLSSGNWSLRSQPDIDPIGNPASAQGMYSKGNREWHVIVEDKALAAVFEKYIAYDRDGSKKENEQGVAGVTLGLQPASARMPDLFVPIEAVADTTMALHTPNPVRPARLPSTARKIKVQPVLTPDNYIGRLNELLDSAERSIYLQYAYITYSDKPGDAPFTAMLKKLAKLSFRPAMDVRIIVGSADAADKIRRLAEAGFNEKVFRTQGSIHNKGIVVDGERVLVSSANWSGDGVIRNRDAGLIIHDEEIALYYQRVFIDDWDHRAKAKIVDDATVRLAADNEPVPAGMVRMSWRDFYG
jgi:phosphatidylserine/phosphatidylglycerophosphate/cardiolipin synthase-like enzyme